MVLAFIQLSMCTCVTRSYKHMYIWYLVNGFVSVLIIVAFPTSEQVQQQIEKMEHQQSELEDLKLKFQEPEAARENQRREIESLKKQGERPFGCEFVELSWLSYYRVNCLFCFWLFIEWLDKWCWAVICIWICWFLDKWYLVLINIL